MATTIQDQDNPSGLRSAIQRLFRPTASVSAPAPAATPAGNRQTLTAYRTSGPYGLTIIPAPATRPWMDATPDRFAYRCLPMLIANQYGWILLNDVTFEAVWDGGGAEESIQISYPPDGLDIEDDTRAAMQAGVSSHFGSGVLTWTLPYLFQTPPGWNLLARGPANWPRDGISALEGIVETDQTASTFTMNWLFTRPGHPVRFERGDPICMIVPQRRGELEAFEPVFDSIENSGPLVERYDAWQMSRSTFLKDIAQGAREAVRKGWQKNYFRGEDIDQRKYPEHVTRITLREFTDKMEPGETAAEGTPKQP